MKRIFSQATELVLRIVLVPIRYIFGRDIFVSYSRSDGNIYAPNLVLALQKKMPKLSVYLDKWIAPPSGKLPASLTLQLKLSSILVVVCSAGATKSPSVRKEIHIFSRTRRKIIIINVDDSFQLLSDEKELWPFISGTSPEREDAFALKNGQPSGNVIERVLKSVEFTTQDRRLRRSVWATACFLVLSIGATLVYSTTTIKSAKKEADKQKSIGDSRRIVNEAGFILDQSPDSLLKSTLLLLKAGAIADSFNYPILEVDKALRHNLGLLPELIDTATFKKADLFSSNYKYTATRIGTKQGIDTIKINQTGNNQQLYSIPCNKQDNLAALSDSGNRIVIATAGAPTIFKVKDLAKGREWDIAPSTGELSIYHVAISSDGKYLLMGYWDNYNMERTVGGYNLVMTAELWEIETKKRIVILDTRGDFSISSVAFSPNGKQIVVTGLGFGYQGTGEGGRAFIWPIAPGFDGLDSTDFKFSRVVAQNAKIDMAAISDDGNHLATMSRRTVFVWKDAGTSEFRQLSCLPLSVSPIHLRFHSYKELWVTTDDKNRNDGFRKLSKWKINSYPGIRIGRDNPIAGFAFQHSDSSIVVIDHSVGPLRERVNKWKIKDGALIEDDHSLRLQGFGEFMVSEYSDTVEVWDLAAGKKLVLPEDSAFAYRSKPFLSAGGEYMCRLEWLEDSSQLMLYKRTAATYVKIKTWTTPIHPDNTTIYISVNSGRIIVTGDLETRIYSMGDGHDITPQGLMQVEGGRPGLLSKNEKYFVVEAQEGEENVDERGYHYLYLWDFENLRLIKRLQSDAWISTYDFSPHSNYFVFGNKDGQLHTWQFRDSSIRITENSSGITAVAFSGDEKYIASGERSGLVKVAEMENRNEVSHLKYYSSIQKIAFSLDNTFIGVLTGDLWQGEWDEGLHFVFISSLRLKDLMQEAKKRVSAFSNFP